MTNLFVAVTFCGAACVVDGNVSKRRSAQAPRRNDRTGKLFLINGRGRLLQIMPGIPQGRMLFGGAIVGFGVLCLVYVDFVHQLQPVPSWVPGYGFLAVLTGIALIAAGGAIATGVKVYPAATGLAAFFALWIVLLQVPSAFVDPILLRSPWWVRTFETLALNAAALILAGLASEPVREGWIRTGRIAFGVSLPVFGILHFIYAGNVASLIPSWYPWPLFLAYLTGAGHFAAGVAIATGVLSRLAAILAGFMYGIWALTLHIPSQFEYERAQGEQTSLFVAIAMWGSAWIVAGSVTHARSRQGTSGC